MLQCEVMLNAVFLQILGSSISGHVIAVATHKVMGLRLQWAIMNWGRGRRSICECGLGSSYRTPPQRTSSYSLFGMCKGSCEFCLEWDVSIPGGADLTWSNRTKQFR